MKSKSEMVMWEKKLKTPISKTSDIEINQKYESGEQRIVTENNNEKLLNFVSSFSKPGYMELKPFYQRRKRWDVSRQSRLIESFIINIPVPPIFLYEKSYGSYEVMDGQQRITAITEFYNNLYSLEGLEIWPELNGKKYADLPLKIKAGIDRRSISSITLLKESAPSNEEAMQLRQMVFDRLNTGGVKLERQEIRNALYQGKMNDLLHELSQNSTFRNSWQLPTYSDEEIKNPNSDIFEYPFYQKMEDLEIILRFFALRHAEHYAYGMQGFLDLYMLRSLSFESEDIDTLKTLFLQTINLASSIYGDIIFQPYNKESNKWSGRPQKAFYDAVMVGLSEYLDKREILVEKKDSVLEKTKQLFFDNDDGTFTGRGNSKNDIEERIKKFSEMIRGICT